VVTIRFRSGGNRMWLIELIYKALGTDSTLAFVLTVAGVFGVGGGLFAFLADRAYKNSPEYIQAHQNAQIAVEWHHGRPPATLPTTGRLYELQVWPIPQENGGGGLSEVSGNPGQAMTWPTPLPTLECQITNYSARTLFNVQAALRLSFRQAVKDKDYPNQSRGGDVILSREWPFTIAKIDSGPEHAFVFYVMNFKDDVFVYVSFADAATGQLEGSAEAKALSVIQQEPRPMNFLSPFEGN
jgi:hypothetical protein